MEDGAGVERGGDGMEKKGGSGGLRVEVKT